MIVRAYFLGLLALSAVEGQKNKLFDKSIVDDETHLTADDFAAAARLRVQFDGKRRRRERVDDSAMYNKDRFEGDIVNSGLHARSIKSFVGEANPHDIIRGVQRNAVRQTYLKWADGRIPYTISAQYSSFSRSKIAEAIEEYRRLTCIDFAPKSAADQDYIHIVPDDGCYSLVGRIGGKQPVSLGDGCIQKGIIVHELMHAVGFFHEQSRADRDEHVNIIWENVEAGLQDQFDKYSLNMIDHLDTKYDYGSVMHYAPTAFSKNAKPTIEPKVKGVEIGQRVGFSPTDLYKINKLYSCPQLVTTTPSPEEEAAEKSRATKKTIRPGRAKNGSLGTRGDLRPEGGNSNTGTSGGGGGGGNPESSSSSPSPGSSGIIGSQGAQCRDRRRDCDFLARSGHCESKFSVKFMAENCAKSCNKCGLRCEDTRTWCSRWAVSGMCTQDVFRDYMQTRCAKSCQLC